MKLEEKNSPKIRPSAHLIRLSPLFAILFMLTNFGCQPLTGQKTALTPSSGAKLFNSKCGKCHDPELALTKNRSADLWRKTINRMKEVHYADINNKEVELLVKYHVERQNLQAGLQENLPGTKYRSPGDQPGKKSGKALFLEKCSSCHTPARALAVFKDPEVWALTIKRMQYYSKREITDPEVNELVDFHVTQQQRELNAFQETCTKCHDDNRISSRSMSDEQWLATIKRMQQKAPELISDEKVDLLAAYFHRRELALARIFYGKCRLCHLDSSGGAPPPGSTRQMDGLIVLSSEEFGRSLQSTDVNNLLAVHVQRQKRNMRLYENNCTACHLDGLPEKQEPGTEKPRERSRAEWIFFIAMLQGVELNKDVQITIDSQIDYHISRH